MRKKYELRELILQIKKIIADVVNNEKGIAISIDDFTDTEDITYSVVLQMNSLMAIRMVVEIEKYFNIEVEDDELDMDNFKNAEIIASFINKKLQ